ncbi:MAG: serine--tRNA ligase [Fimbriimonadaceae bacterium]|nr:serine--tRNA ligase [Fimbriimonadaceae bacterium]
MLDRHFIRTNAEAVRAGAAKKNIEAPVDELVALDAEWRGILLELESCRAEMNAVSKSIGQLMSQGKRDEAEAAKGQTKAFKERLDELEVRMREVEEGVRTAELNIPNPPHASVPAGTGEADNVVVREWGEKPTHTPPPHWEIATGLDLLDFPRGTKISGSGFVLYTGIGARLQRSLFNWMIDHQTGTNGYREVYPPYVVNADSLRGTGQLPKFEEDLYKTSDGFYLVPTAEVPVTNIYRDEILNGDDLTIKLAAVSGCFRREAGAAGKDTRGLQRVHQFDKVEMVKFAKPEDSYDELEAMVRDAESVLQALGLHYRVVLLCGPEMSFSNAKCYDLEIWSPAMNKYLEISSCSNFEAFQARRANIRFRRAPGEKPEFVHTLNGSGLALPRLYAVLLETFWNEDGTITLPEPLRPYVGRDRLTKE